jgi:beta-glucanase (GH16 family)
MISLSLRLKIKAWLAFTIALKFLHSIFDLLSVFIMAEPTGGVPQIPGWDTVWADPFLGPEGTLPDTYHNWNVISAGPNTGNNEVETYTSNTNNVCLSGNPQGGLWIQPQRDGNGNWTSGRLESIPSFACDAGGLMILQANLITGLSPSSQQNGIWPAFWALGESIRSSGVPWPQCGEWDIMENSSGANFTLASLHYGTGSTEQSQGGGGNSQAYQTITLGQFNTYTLLVDRTPSTWQEETITWFLNGFEWFSVSGEQVGDPNLWANVAHSPFYAVLNVAVGTNFPGAGNNGQPDGNTATGLGSGMQVSYVAFYKTNSDIPFDKASGKDAVQALAVQAPQAEPATRGVNIAIAPGQQVMSPGQ